MSKKRERTISSTDDSRSVTPVPPSSRIVPGNSEAVAKKLKASPAKMTDRVKAERAKSSTKLTVPPWFRLLASRPSKSSVSICHSMPLIRKLVTRRSPNHAMRIPVTQGARVMLRRALKKL